MEGLGEELLDLVEHHLGLGERRTPSLPELSQLLAIRPGQTDPAGKELSTDADRSGQPGRYCPSR